MRNIIDKKSGPKLTKKQKVFCDEYLVSLNATQAAIKAEYSKNIAAVQEHENLSKPYIQKYIQKAMDERAKKTGVDAAYAVNGIRDIAEKIGIKDSDRLKAFELLGKHLKLFTERHEHLGERGGPIPISVIKEYATPNFMDDKTENTLRL